MSDNQGSMAEKFGTFGGVFTPCTLTILGVIMFLRFGQVIGQAGVLLAIGIVLVSKLITTLTALSLSAVATNTRVKGGGAYFLISRSLGAEFGGVIGILFFLAQAISVSLYIIGFTEAFLAAFPQLTMGSPEISMRVIATVVNLVVFVCVYIGAGWTIKLQYGILAILLLSILSFVAGAVPVASMSQFKANLSSSFTSGQSVLTMFALFFPAVTGIMAGANMSGDLKSPARSIPLGTLSSIVFTGAIYLGLAVLLGASRSQESLLTNNLIMNDIAWSPTLILAGVFAATLSSALGSMMGAPRILQAFAKDEILPQIKSFAQGSGKSNEPRKATILTFVIAQAAIMLGALDLIAPIITMFFMITYGTLNLACFYESITNNPSYRPSFRFSHWSTALLGAVSCFGVMILLAPVAAILAILVMAGIYWYFVRSEVRARWGDVRSGMAYERARRALLKLEDERYHPKNWRPTILVLSGGAWKRKHLAKYGYWLTAGHGILSLGHVIEGDVENRIDRRKEQERDLRHFIREEELSAFPAVVVAVDLNEGVKSLIQSHGIGGIRPNTVMLGWSNDSEHFESFGATLRLIRDMQRSIILVRCDEVSPWDETPEGTIDIWWRGKGHGALMLMLAHLLTQSQLWRERPIRLLHAITPDASLEEAEASLNQLLEQARIRAIPEVIVTDNLIEEVHQHSAQAAVVLFGFNPPEEGKEAEFVEQTNLWMDGLDNVILVSSSGGISLTG